MRCTVSRLILSQKLKPGTCEHPAPRAKKNGAANTRRFPPRRLTRQQAPRHCRVALCLVVRRHQLDLYGVCLPACTGFSLKTIMPRSAPMTKEIIFFPCYNRRHAPRAPTMLAGTLSSANQPHLADARDSSPPSRRAAVYSRAHKPGPAGTASCTFPPGWTASSIVIT
jgi:hypothetical protein